MPLTVSGKTAVNVYCGGEGVYSTRVINGSASAVTNVETTIILYTVPSDKTV